MLTQCCFFQHEQRLIMQQKSGFYEFVPFTARSRTRFQLQAFPFDDLHLLQHAHVVDITYNSNSIFIIAKSPQNIISQEPDPIATSLHELYLHLSPELRRIIGHVEWPEPHTLIHLVDSVKHGTAIGVSDGSVRTNSNKATHAWIIQAQPGIEISGSGLVDGTDDARTSHRAEIQGTTALFLILSLLVKFFHITGGKILTYCDNQAVVTKLKKGWSIWRYRHTKGPDGDLQALLCQVTKQLQKDFQTQHSSEWVQGHQDKDKQTDLTRQATLNIRMDHAAKKAYDLPQPWQTDTYISILQAECVLYTSTIESSHRIFISH
jgi:hypothetical protein